VVNEVWESCFHDTRPFDEIYKWLDLLRGQDFMFLSLVSRSHQREDLRVGCLGRWWLWDGCCKMQTAERHFSEKTRVCEDERFCISRVLLSKHFMLRQKAGCFMRPRSWDC